MTLLSPKTEATLPQRGSVGGGDERKMAERLTDSLLAEIGARGLKPGALLGSMAELGDRYAVSNATLREAIRILERHGILRSKRGPGGGIIIGSSGGGSAAKVLSVFAESLGFPIGEVHHCLGLLEMEAARLGAARADGADFDRLHARSRWSLIGPPPIDWMVGVSIRRISGIGELSGNRLLGILLDALLQLRAELFPQFDGDSWNRLIQANTARSLEVLNMLRIGDLAGATSLIWHWHLRELPELLAPSAAASLRLTMLSGPQLVAREIAMGEHIFKRRMTLAEAMAHLIVREIRERDLWAGDRLGQEAQWLGHFGVARPAFREAVRMLERDRIVEMRRGNGGGLFVGAPDAEPMLAALRLLLAQEGVDRTQRAELRAIILPEIATAVATAGQQVAGEAARIETGDTFTLGQRSGLKLLPLLYRAVEDGVPSDESPVGWAEMLAAIGRGDPLAARRAALAWAVGQD